MISISNFKLIFFLSKQLQYNISKLFLLYIISVPLLINAQNTVNGNLSSKVLKEVDGIVVIEAENTTSNLDKWEKMTSIEDFTGTGYIVFGGNKPEKGPATSPLKYQFKVQKAGLYYLHIRAAKEIVVIRDVERKDVANDCYVRVEGDYDEGPNAGENKGDNAYLNILKNDTKFFGGANQKFVWSSGARLDIKSAKVKAVYNFKANEIYTLVISGRSQLYKLDRIVFRKVDVPVDVAQSIDLKEVYVD